MKKESEHLRIVELSDSAITQHINSRTAFTELERTRRELLDFRGSMFWRLLAQRPQEYLIRTMPNKAQKSLGPRGSETEAIHAKFTTGKAQAEARVKDLEKELKLCEARNRGYEVGHTPELIVSILNRLNDAGLGKHLTVIGSNALYAYESAAFVRIQDAVLQTKDVDLLWDNRKRLSLSTQTELSERGMLGQLQKVDPTFRLRDDQLFTAINSRGFEVDLVRPVSRTPAEKADVSMRRLSDVEEDFWVSEITSGAWLLSAPRFSQMVVSASGKMARMTVPDPRAFALAKMYLADKPTREPGKKQKDYTQALVVTQMVKRYLPALEFDALHVFPQRIAERLKAEGMEL